MKAKAPFDFTIDCGPGTLWKIRVFVWSTIGRLHRERVKGSHPSITKPDCDAFCRQYDMQYAARDGVVAEMHFHFGDLRPETVIHEAVHAVVAYGKLAKLDWTTRAGDEAFAECVEHVFCGVRWFLRRRTKKK